MAIFAGLDGALVITPEGGTLWDRERSPIQGTCTHGKMLVSTCLHRLRNISMTSSQCVPLTVPSTRCTAEPAPNWPLAFLQHPGCI